MRLKGQTGSAKVMYGIAWFLLIAMLVGFAHLLTSGKSGIDSKIRVVRSGDRGRIVKVEPNASNHFVLPCEINGVKVKCLLDTGATYVSIPAKYEKQMRLKRGFAFNVSTGNGDVRVFATKLEEMEISGFRLKNIKASITPSMKTKYVLLGMSALKYLDWHMEGRYLFITYRG